MSGNPRCGSPPRPRLSETFKRDTRSDGRPSQHMTAQLRGKDHESTRARRIPSPDVDSRIRSPSPPRQYYRPVDTANSTAYRRGDILSGCDLNRISRERNQNDAASIPPSLPTYKALRINHHGVENVPVGPTSVRKARRLPHIHITASSLPVARTTIPHLRYVRFYQPSQVLMDDEGYYILFEDSFFGRKGLHACHQRSNMRLFFNQYRLHMVRYPHGLDNPTCPNETDDNPSSRRSTTCKAADSQPQLGNTTAPVGSSNTPEDNVRIEVKSGPVASDESRPPPKMPTELMNGRHVASSSASFLEDGAGDISHMVLSAPDNRYDHPSAFTTFTATARRSSRQDFDDDSSMSGMTAVSNMSTTRIKKCHVCDKSTDLDRMVQCQSCPRIYHTRCHKWQPAPTQTQDMQPWSCYRCVKRKLLKTADGGQATSANAVATPVDTTTDMMANKFDAFHHGRQQRLETKSCRIQPVGCSSRVTDEVSMPASRSLTSDYQAGPRPLNTSLESMPNTQAPLSKITPLKTSRRLWTEQPVIEDLFLDDVLNVAGNNAKSEASEPRSEVGRSRPTLTRTKLNHAGPPDRKSPIVNDSAELSGKSTLLSDVTTRLAKSDQALVEQTNQAAESASSSSRNPELSIDRPNPTAELNPKQTQASSAKATAKRTKAKVQLCVTCHGALPPFHLSNSCRKCEVKEATPHIGTSSSVNVNSAEPTSPSPAVAHSHATTSRGKSDACLVSMPNDKDAAKELTGSNTKNSGIGVRETPSVGLPAHLQQSGPIDQQIAKSRGAIFTTKSLIFMSMSDAPGYRVQCSDVCRWIAMNIPDMRRGTGRWEQNVSAILSKNIDTGGRTRTSHLWVRSYGEDGRSTWYTLRADLRKRTERWDPVLQEAVPPSPAISLQVEGRSHCKPVGTSHDIGKGRESAKKKDGIRKEDGAALIAGISLERQILHTPKLNTEPAHDDDDSSSSSEPIRMRVKRRKISRTVQLTASRKCSPSTRSSLKGDVVGDSRKRNTMDSNQVNRQEQAVQYQSSSEDEPIARRRLKRGIRLMSSGTKASTSSPEPLTPLLTDNDTQINPYSASSTARFAKRDHVTLNLHKSGDSRVSAQRSDCSGSSRRDTPKLSSRAVRELDRLSNRSASTISKRSHWESTTGSRTLIDELMLRGSFQTEAPDTEYSVRSFFEEYPEYHVTYSTSTAAKQLEISDRLSRKQLFKKPAAYSLLTNKDLDKKSSFRSPSNSPREPCNLDQMPIAPRQSNFDATLAGKIPRTETIFKSLDEFFDSPKSPLPVIS
nr:hypothetical protein CFP56_23994 [Quercus suber]